VFSVHHWLQVPDLKDAEAMQRFFLQEVQLGEELLAAGQKLRVSVLSLFLQQCWHRSISQVNSAFGLLWARPPAFAGLQAICGCGLFLQHGPHVSWPHG